MVDLEGAQTEELVNRLRAQSWARVERVRRRRVTFVSALSVGFLASLIGGLEAYREQVRQRAFAAAEAEEDAREAARSAEVERRFEAAMRELDETIARAELEAKLAEIRAEGRPCSRSERHHTVHERFDDDDSPLDGP